MCELLEVFCVFFFFFKQKTAYEMRISDWSSDVCSSDLGGGSGIGRATARHFAGHGWFVGLADVNAQGIDETAALLPEGASSRHVMDVRDRDQWAQALTDFAAASSGRLEDRKSTRLNSSH